jgi:hypothetical protein
VITTGSEKVQMARTVIALKVSGHDEEPRSALGWESVTDNLRGRLGSRAGRQALRRRIVN